MRIRILYIFATIFSIFSIQSILVSAQECISIDDLTGDTTVIGNPATLRHFIVDPRNPSFSPPSFLDYNEDDYYVYYRNMHGTEVVIAYSKNRTDITVNDRTIFTQHACNIWNYLWNVFHGFPFTTYTIVFLDQIRYDGAHGGGYEQDVTMAPDCGHSQPHEIIHGWISGGNGAINPQENSKEKWIIEGMTDYYTYRVKALLNQNMRNLNEVQEYFDSFIRECVDTYIYEIRGTQYDIPLIDMGYEFSGTDKAIYYYRKGALVAYLLDKQLNQDGSNLDELLREIYKQFNYGEAYYTTEDFLEIANELTGEDYTGFFNDYVYDKKMLPIDHSTYFRFFVNSTPSELLETDTTPPMVSSTNPANNATDVAVNTAITVTFSESMDSSTINTDTFLVSGSGNIAGTVIYTDTTATFTPETDLDYNTTYTATITTGAKDLAGNALQEDYTWSFTTQSDNSNGGDSNGDGDSGGGCFITTLLEN